MIQRAHKVFHMQIHRWHYYLREQRVSKCKHFKRKHNGYRRRK